MHIYSLYLTFSYIVCSFIIIVYVCENYDLFVFVVPFFLLVVFSISVQIVWNLIIYVSKLHCTKYGNGYFFVLQEWVYQNVNYSMFLINMVLSEKYGLQSHHLALHLLFFERRMMQKMQ